MQEALHLAEIVEGPVGGGGDGVDAHEVLGEGLARLDFGGALVWAEDWDAEFLEMVHDARRQRRFGADDGEVDAFLFSANFARPAISSAAMGMHSACRAMPALPGRASRVS